ncbi:MAG: methylmalonyl-CoA decarboxylase [Filomicrobium sp.]
MPLAQIDITGPIGTITLTHPEKRNALSAALIDVVIDGLVRMRRENVHALVLRAERGAKVRSAGHDVCELPEGGRDPLGWDDPLRHLVRAIEEFPAPVIAMVEGSVWGGACETVFSTDLIVATPDATFAVTPAKLGVPYNVSGMLTFLNATTVRIIKEMTFTGRPVSADRAERAGLINSVVPADELEAFTYDLTEAIAENAPLAIAVMKEQLRILAGAHPMSPQGFERIQGLRRLVYGSNDYNEGVRAFKEKRKAVFRGT